MAANGSTRKKIEVNVSNPNWKALANRLSMGSLGRQARVTVAPATQVLEVYRVNQDTGQHNAAPSGHLVSDVKRAATMAPGSVWKARISLPPLTRNPRMVIDEGPSGSTHMKCTEQSLST